MGQGCCIPIDKGKRSIIEQQSWGGSGWRSMVQTVLDFEQMDQTLNRLKQSDVMVLQAQFRKYAIGVKGQSPSGFRSQYLTGDALCDLFPGIIARRSDQISFDYLLALAPGLGTIQKKTSFNSSASSSVSSTPSSEFPLKFSSAAMIRAFSFGGFLSASGYLDMVSDCAELDLDDAVVDFRDLCHTVSICTTGSQKEMLVFLFLLFANETICLSPTSNSSLLGSIPAAPLPISGRSSKLSGKKSGAVPDSGRVPSVSTATRTGDSSDNRSVDTDATGSSVSTVGKSSSPRATSHSKPDPAVLEPVLEQRSFQEVHLGTSRSYQFGLSRDGLESLLYFCALGPLVWGSDSFLLSCASGDETPVQSPRSFQHLKAEALKISTANLSLLLDIGSRLGSTIKSPSQVSNSLFPLSLKAFVTIALSGAQVTPSASLPDSGDSSPSLPDSILSSNSLRRSLSLFSLSLSPHQERASVLHALKIDQEKRQECCYLLSASWWRQWCEYVQVQTTFADLPDGLVVGIDPASKEPSSASASPVDGSIALSNGMALFKPDKIDNSNIADPQWHFLLKSKQYEARRDFVVVSVNVWNALKKIYSINVDEMKLISDFVFPRSAAPLIRQMYLSPDSPRARSSSGILLQPLVALMHWCTAIGVSTSCATDKILCCSCHSDTGASSADSSSRLSRTTHSACCSVEDILQRILAIYELQGPWSTADDTPQMMQLSDFRLWLFRDSPSAASPGSTILPVLPFYQSKVVEKSTAVWELLENAESVALSSLVCSNICRLMVECKNVNRAWPTETQLESSTSPSPASQSKLKVGERVLVKDSDGEWSSGSVLKLNYTNIPGANETDERTKVLVEVEQGPNKVEMIAGLNAISAIPKMNSAPALLVHHLLSSFFQQPMAGSAESLRAPAKSSGFSSTPSTTVTLQSKASSRSHNPALVALSKSQDRSTDNGDASTSQSVVEVELFSMSHRVKSSSVTPQLQNVLLTADGSTLNGDVVIHVRCRRLFISLESIPFIDECIPSDIWREFAFEANINSAPDQLASANAKGSETVTPQYTSIPNGLAGLWNLGNTCYMSAALQCISRTPLLPLYFLSGRFRRDLNRGNALGTGGRLTEEFASLLFLMWSSDSPDKSTTIVSKRPAAQVSVSVSQTTSKSVPSGSMSPTSGKSTKAVTPKLFKKVLDKSKSQFEGNHQQDAQEFLSELLDSLHEDLNKFDRKKEEQRAKIKEALATSSVASAATDGEATKADVAATPIKETLAKRKGSLNKGTPTGAEVGIDESPLRARGSASRQSSLQGLEMMAPAESATPPSKPSEELAIADVHARGEVEWCKHLNRNKSVLVDMFQGQQCTEVKCRVCGYSNFTFDPFMSLSLPLPKQQDVSVVVTVLRKMPRVRAFIESAFECADSGNELAVKMKYAAKSFIHTYRTHRKPIRLVVNLPRLSELTDLSAAVNKALVEKYQRSAAATTSSSSGTVTVRAPPAENLLLVECSPNAVLNAYTYQDMTRILDEREVLAHLSDSAVANKVGFPFVLAAENSKDLSFISALQGERFLMRDGSLPQHSKIKGSSSDSSLQDSARSASKTPKPSVSPDGFTDELEYFKDKRGYEGDVVVDIDADFCSRLQDPNKRCRNWPETLSGLEVGRRVDAADSKGNWFAASIVEHWKVSTKDLAAIRQSIEDDSVSAGGLPLEIGLHVRVHFDNYSSKWDEWMSSKDFLAGRLAPIYSKTERKVRMLDLYIYHRRPVTSVPPSRSGRNTSSVNDAPDLELVGVPYIVQCESFRSCEHAIRHIIEQSLRYASGDEVRSFLEALFQQYFHTLHSERTSDGSSEGEVNFIPWPLELLPFSVRLCSVANVLAPCIPTVLASKRSDVRTSLPISREHKFWEGSEFPADKERPVCNIHHGKLCVIIDWKPQIQPLPATIGDGQSSSKSISVPSTRFSGQEYDDDESFTRFCQVQSGLKGKKAKGVTLEECFRVYAGREELDENSWVCEKCKKPSKGTVITSLNRLPDVLIVHVKRFNMTARFGEKIRTLVSFPFRDLDLSPYSTEYIRRTDTDVGRGEESKYRYKYDLYGVVNHIGNMTGGHYTAFVHCPDDSLFTNQEDWKYARHVMQVTAAQAADLDLTNVLDDSAIFKTDRKDAAGNPPSGNGRWYLFDDHCVEEVPNNKLEQFIVTESAYLLFYRRQSLTPSTIINIMS